MEGAGGSKEGDEDDGGAEKNKSIEDARPLKSADSIDAGLIMDAGTILSNGSKAEADSKMTADMAEDSGLSDSMLSLVLFAVGSLHSPYPLSVCLTCLTRRNNIYILPSSFISMHC